VQSALYPCGGWFFAVIDELDPGRRNFVRVERRKEADLHRTFIFATFEPYVHPLTEAELNELLGIGETRD
jgi:hypothetical protein